TWNAGSFGCATDAAGACSWPFDIGSYADQVTSATSTLIHRTGSALSLAASSSVLTYASSTAFTVSENAYFPGFGVWNSFGEIGIGTTSPFAKFAIQANSGETNTRLFEIASSTGN